MQTIEIFQQKFDFDDSMDEKEIMRRVLDCAEDRTWMYLDRKRWINDEHTYGTARLVVKMSGVPLVEPTLRPIVSRGTMTPRELIPMRYWTVSRKQKAMWRKKRMEVWARTMGFRIQWAMQS